MNEQELLKRINKVSSLSDLGALRIDLLGRKGSLTLQLKEVGRLPAPERAAAGAESNRLRQAIEQALEDKQKMLSSVAREEKLGTPLDLTAPGELPKLGHRHPVSVVLDELIDLFWQMGYQIEEGPEIETEWYNFEALLVDKNHP